LPHHWPTPPSRSSCIGDQNYYNVRASVEASGVLEGAPYTVDWKHFQPPRRWRKR
jgi:hypothetical protein